MIKDSGERRVFANGFQRDMSEGKGRFDLLPWGAIWEVAKHCEEGAKKYGERNIDKGCPQNSLIDSAMRHLAEYTMGFTDENHLRAAAWNVMWALQQNVYRKDMLNIPPMEVFTDQEHERISEMEKLHDFFTRQMKCEYIQNSEEKRCVETSCLWNTDFICEAGEQQANCECYVED